MQLDHIGIAVRDRRVAATRYRDLLPVDREEEFEVAGERVAITMLWVGEVKLELLSPLRSEGPLVEFLASRGEGLHHIAFRVPDLDTAIRSARSRGFRVIYDPPRIGAYGRRITFLHPGGLHGTLLELVEQKPA